MCVIQSECFGLSLNGYHNPVIQPLIAPKAIRRLAFAPCRPGIRGVQSHSGGHQCCPAARQQERAADEMAPGRGCGAGAEAPEQHLSLELRKSYMPVIFHLRDGMRPIYQRNMLNLAIALVGAAPPVQGGSRSLRGLLILSLALGAWGIVAAAG
jgi:hypothetical protein